MAERVGDRVYEVRRLLGPDARTEMTLRDFAALLSSTSARLYHTQPERIKTYDPSDVSKIERGKRGVSLDDCAVIAAVDPLSRGPAWVAWKIPLVGEVRGDESPPGDPAKPLPRPLPRPDAAAPKKGRGTA